MQIQLHNVRYCQLLPGICRAWLCPPALGQCSFPKKKCNPLWCDYCTWPRLTQSSLLIWQTKIIPPGVWRSLQELDTWRDLLLREPTWAIINQRNWILCRRLVKSDGLQTKCNAHRMFLKSPRTLEDCLKTCIRLKIKIEVKSPINWRTDGDYHF